MHPLFRADEVRPVAEVPALESQPKPAELKLARELISHLRSDRFAPERYEDVVRKRIRALIDQKVAGGDLKAVEGSRPRAKVVELMEARKASLAERGKEGTAARASPAPVLRKAG